MPVQRSFCRFCHANCAILVETEGDRVERFREKPKATSTYVNGGFFVCEKSVLDRIAGDEMPFEDAPLASLARDGELSVYRHNGFWAAMDTLRDKTQLERMWSSGEAPWKIW